MTSALGDRTGSDPSARAQSEPEILEDLAYVYDGSLEGLLCAIFEAYARKENPSDVWPEAAAAPRLLQRVSRIDTDTDKAERVRRGLTSRWGRRCFSAIRKASVACGMDAGTAAYRFVRYAMDEHTGRRSPLSNIAHPAVEPLRSVCRSVSNECERMRQFVRFEHVCSGDAELWFSKVSPKHAVVPLIMGHFVERFSIQAFVIYDEAHGVCGIHDGRDWSLAMIDDKEAFEALIPERSSEESSIQDAWRRFYRAVSIDERYNPELRRHFMPKRLWANITELQGE